MQFDRALSQARSGHVRPGDSNHRLPGSGVPGATAVHFTLGDWSVDLDGPLGGGSGGLRSSITTDLSGCLVDERLTGGHGYEARVFSSARRRSGQWFHTFVDNRGLRVFLTGQEQGGTLVLDGKLPAGGALAADVRVTWSRSPAGGSASGGNSRATVGRRGGGCSTRPIAPGSGGPREGVGRRIGPERRPILRHRGAVAGWLSSGR